MKLNCLVFLQCVSVFLFASVWVLVQEGDPTISHLRRSDRNMAVQPRGPVCECGRMFGRLSDLKRHKCVIERLKPVGRQEDVSSHSAAKEVWLCKNSDKTLVHSDFAL